MRKVRKDSHGRVLRTGEFERYDGIYVFQKTVCGNKKTIYASSLEGLRHKVSEAVEYRFDELGKNLKSITLDKAFERFMLSRIIRNTTAYVQRNLYDHYIKKRLGKKKVQDITHSDIRQLLIYHFTEKHLSLNTIKSIQGMLHAIFALMVSDQVITINPAQQAMKALAHADSSGLREESNGQKVLTTDEEKAFLMYAKETDSFFYPLWIFMLSTGARVGEASAICWEDIDFEKKIVSINKTLVCTYKGKERIFSFNPTKTKNGVRKLPILSTLYDVLEKMKNDKAMRKSFPHEDNLLINDQELIFYCVVNNRIRAVSNFDVNHALKKLITNYNSDKLFKEMHPGVPASLPIFSSHALRHTFCSRLCENEVNLKVIQEIMGHGNIHMTMDVYAQSNEKKNSLSLLQYEKKILGE